MWNEIAKYLPQFPSAVLTSVDADGYPLSVRCKPQLDAAAQVVRLRAPADLGIQPGPAALLCHSHDEHLWSLKGFAVRGTLEREGDDWMLRPAHFLPGTGLGSLLPAILGAQRKARRYLKKRSLPRPSVPWDKLKALKTPKS
ncbi:MAG TPA: hypothetical protein VH599_16465 [Ktedonobacterales bacterium]|jgi:hypothetical protein